MIHLKPITVPFLLFWAALLQGQNATVFGTILDEEQSPIPNVNIVYGDAGTVSDDNGYFILQVVADTPNTLTFSHVGFKDIVVEQLTLLTNETFELNPVMYKDVVQVAGVEVSATGEKKLEGITTISPQTVRKIPGANAGVENVLKLIPGVSFNNELSTQYHVRGGNFDENLVYVNGIQVYRPFLIRSAQQEGLSFVNSDMVSGLDFSPGGFQAKYGDALSSVLDITYKTPTRFGLRLNGSFLGGSGTLETASKNKKFTSITGVRYRNNSLLVNSQQTESNLNPKFVDAQNYLTYRFSNVFHLSFLGTYSINDYENEPFTRQTNFGTINDPKALLVFYQGRENNTYTNALGALKLDYYLGDNTVLGLTSSLYHTQEEEFSDIIASYELGPVDTDFSDGDSGDANAPRGIGSQFTRARNQLDALIFTISHTGKFSKNRKTLEWGLKFTHEDIRDQLRESEFIDSAGYIIRPSEPPLPNNQPEEPFLGDILPYESAMATNYVKTSRLAGFIQYAHQMDLKNQTLYFNVGTRIQHWTISGEGFNNSSQTIFSPRVQFSIKPNWERDVLFRFSTGSYQQPPFYRELRDITGSINPQVKAQKSIHYVLGSEYSFNLKDRPFTLLGEAYYKDLKNVNPYTIEDVRLRYAAQNNTTAFAYGVDLRLVGAFVPGTESWVSLGYLQTKENIAERGYIPRPTDQRLKFAMLFQDYMPNIPNLRLYLNLVYNTGVPGGSPNTADPYNFQNRLRDYKRADMGISYIFADEKNKHPQGHWLYKFRECSVGFEIFNLFNTQNSITNTWVRDVDTQRQFAVPNYLTSRVFNLKFGMRF
ncbi:TonB-dependent receptor [Flagellimonas alvinocaridis]|uniref:TonB-dependent receptor n=1 Tax=Flagellimonas alvinocaridis TaxID=2530200 RepID=A0A4S8RY34_9FLAO|nr:carboxypeptidase-like regulatory domain-containing protein [Allomuricauda alvinocaridis]THV60309.1 TonB-dependent receptor [Allomuricauda alvinocaridis]